MKLKERPEFLQKRETLTFPPETNVSVAVREMAARDFGSVIIVDGEKKPLGIFTERDLLKRVVGKQKDPSSTPLKDVMTSNLRMAKDDDDLIDWLRMMSNERFRHLPVVDADGHLMTVMSQGDFVSYTWPELLGRVSEQTRASLGGKYYPYFIAAAIMIYTLLVVVVLN